MDAAGEIWQSSGARRGSSGWANGMTRGFGAGQLAQFFQGDEHLAQGQGAGVQRRNVFVLVMLQQMCNIMYQQDRRVNTAGKFKSKFATSGV
jgi:hypothetical protein